jgi:hypothetical protein
MLLAGVSVSDIDIATTDAAQQLVYPLLARDFRQDSSGHEIPFFNQTLLCCTGRFRVSATVSHGSISVFNDPRYVPIL